MTARGIEVREIKIYRSDEFFGLIWPQTFAIQDSCDAFPKGKNSNAT